MSSSLLSTKFYVPPARAYAVSRPRLTEKMMSCVNSPGSFALLSGPAGFGKTTLLSEFTAQLQKPVAWLSLDEGDNDPVRFWKYLIAACQTVLEGVGESTLVLFGSPQQPPFEAVPVNLINDLDRMDRDLVLVLDDYHVIQNETIHKGLLFLLEHLPQKLHLIISTRADPPWPLARFRARNQLVDLFIPVEVNMVLNEGYPFRFAVFSTISLVTGLFYLIGIIKRRALWTLASKMDKLDYSSHFLPPAFLENQKAGSPSGL